MNDFPNHVNVQPAIAVEGDFGSDNPRATVVAGPGAFIAGALGVIVGAFAWADATFTTLNSFGAGNVTGLIGREGLRADIVTPGPGYPAYSQLILPGAFITAYKAGDFFVRNNGSTTSAIGDTCYASFATGLASFGAAGSPPVSAAFSSGAVVANVLNASAITPNVFTATIAGQVMTVSAITTGLVFPGQVLLSGTGIDPGTVVLNQLTGTAGSTGTYTVSVSQMVATAASITGSGGCLTVTTMTSGKVWPGQVLTRASVTAGTTVLTGGTGTGGAGTYPVSVSQTVADASTGTLSGGVFTATTLTSGSVLANQTLTSASGSANILAFGTGGTTGVGVGGGTTYALSNASEAGDTSGFSVKSGVATKWTAQSIAAPGELVLISSVPLS